MKLKKETCQWDQHPTLSQESYCFRGVAAIFFYVQCPIKIYRASRSPQNFITANKQCSILVSNLVTNFKKG